MNKNNSTIQTPSEHPLNEMLDEIVDCLNEQEYSEALKVVRRHFDLRNVWLCPGCGHESNSYQILRGCPKCNAEMTVQVVKGEQGTPLSDPVEHTPKIPIKCKLANNRLIPIGYAWEEIAPYCCIHGIKLRWTCEWCEQWTEKNTP